MPEDEEERRARALDAEDALGGYRARFRIPRNGDGELAYFAGNSLGLQPVAAERAVADELESWARHAVDAHFQEPRPWYSYHERLRAPLARLVGALPHEVVAMNGLTVNLHLMMTSFFRPTPERHKILMEDCGFPSDTYAAQSQARLHGYGPESILVARGESETLAMESLERLLELRGREIALVLIGGVNYYTGQVFDMQRLTAWAHRQGAVVGLDLAHAVGNVSLALHDWDVDFAVWCSYKYLNGGPGAVAGCFVHERHARCPDLPRLAGWWGNDPSKRFRMHLERTFEAAPGADGWQISNPPILAMAPLCASLALFDEAGLEALRAKSRRLTAYLQSSVDRVGAGRIDVLTPPEPARGCQLSLRVRERGRELFGAFQAAGIVTDFREPDVIRVAPVPLYNSFHDVWRLGRVLGAWSQRPGDT